MRFHSKSWSNNLKINNEKCFWGIFAELDENRKPKRIHKSFDLYGSISKDKIRLTKHDEIFLDVANNSKGRILELGFDVGFVSAGKANDNVNIEVLDFSDYLNTSATDSKCLNGRFVHDLQDIFKKGQLSAACESATFDHILMPNFSFSRFPNKEIRMELFSFILSKMDNETQLVFNIISEFDGSLTNNVHSSNLKFPDREINLKSGWSYNSKEKKLNENIFWHVSKADKNGEFFISTRDYWIFDLNHIENELVDAGLTILKKQTNLDQDIGILSHKLYCKKREKENYNLWHPHLPLNLIKDNILVLESGQGLVVKDTNNKQYYDMSGGLWSVQCGLGNTKIIDAINKQLKTLSYATLFAARGNQPSIELSRRLIDIAPPLINNVYLTNSGSESVELSLKLARLYNEFRGATGKKGIAYLDKSYHGTFFGSMGVSGLFLNKEALSPQLPGLFSIKTPHPDDCPNDLNYLDFSIQCAQEL